MIRTVLRVGGPLLRSNAIAGVKWLKGGLQATGPPLLYGLRLWASVCLALYVAFAFELENAFWASTSGALVCLPRLGASLRKGWYRMIGTVIGGAFVVALTGFFPQGPAAFLIGLALWTGLSAAMSAGWPEA